MEMPDDTPKIMPLGCRGSPLLSDTNSGGTSNSNHMHLRDYAPGWRAWVGRE